MSGLNSFNDKSYSDFTLDEKKDDVLKFLCLKGVGFTTELSRFTGINIEAMNDLLFNLNKMKFIEKIYPNPDVPQAVFRKRLNEIWAMNIIGFESFSKKSWWIITETGIEYLKLKYKGQKVQIRDSVIEQLNLKVED